MTKLEQMQERARKRLGGVLLATGKKELELVITEVWNEAIKHSHQCHLNGWGIKKDLVSRCFECGKEAESGITWEQALNANALGGSCFECANKKGATPAESKHYKQ